MNIVSNGTAENDQDLTVPKADPLKDTESGATTNKNAFQKQIQEGQFQAVAFSEPTESVRGSLPSMQNKLATPLNIISSDVVNSGQDEHSSAVNPINEEEQYSFQPGDRPQSQIDSCLNIEIPNDQTVKQSEKIKRQLEKEARREAKKEAKREAKKLRIFNDKVQLRRQVVKVNLQKCGLSESQISQNALMLLSDDVLAEIPMQEFMMRIENEKNVLSKAEVKEETADHQHHDAEAEEVDLEEHEISQRREDFSDDDGIDKNASQKILLNQKDRSEIQQRLDEELVEQGESVIGTLKKSVTSLQMKAKKNLSMQESRSLAKARRQTMWGQFLKKEEENNEEEGVKNFEGVTIEEMGEVLSQKKSKKQTLSYRALKKMIIDNHPIDPDTLQQFLPWESVTVSGYNFKVADSLCCGCMQLQQTCITFSTSFREYIYGKQKHKTRRPNTLDDEPSSDDDNKDTYQGLPNAAIHLGEGAVLYLQMMKTFAILFFILSVVNIPLFVLYSNSSPNRDSISEGNYEDQSFYSNFMLGNLGITQKLCQNSFIDYDSSKQIYEQGPFPPQVLDDDGNLVDQIPTTIQTPSEVIYDSGFPKTPMKFSCPNGYISEVIDFGFLYLLNHETSIFSNGTSLCEGLQNKPASNVTVAESKQTLFDDMVMKPQYQPNITQNNVDSVCNLETMFRTKEDQELFEEFLKEKCLSQSKCEINFDDMKIEKADGQSQQYKLSEMLSLSCYDRIFNKQLTSMEFVAIMGCRIEDLKVPFTSNVFFAKKYIGLITISIDFICLYIAAQFYRKLRLLNEEYCRIIDDNDIRMSDFTVRINNFNLSKATQDVRMLKMKIWLHFTQTMNPERDPLEGEAETFGGEKENMKQVDRCEVADVQVSSYSNQPKYKCLFMMQKHEERMEECRQKMKSKLTDAKDMALLKKQLKQNKEQFQKHNNKFALELAKESKSRAVTTIPKIDFVNSVDYIWVTFKDSESNKKAKNLFQKKGSAVLLAQKVMSEVKEELLLEGQELDVTEEKIQPDQYLWQNLFYSFNQIRLRSHFFIIITIGTALASLLVSLVFSGLQGELGIDINCQGLDISAKSSWTQQTRLDIQLEAIGQTPKGEDEIKLSDSMICYCRDITQNGKEPWQVSTAQEQFLQINPDLDENDIPPYCQAYMKLAVKKQGLMAANDYYILLINSFVAAIFQMMSDLQKKHNTLDQRTQTFWQIFILEFFNMSGVYFLLAFDANGLTKQLLQADLPESKSQGYQDFDSKWYMDNGTRLCITIFLGTITSNTVEITTFLKVQKARFQDRGWTTMSIKKDLEDDEDDAPNTQQVTQKYLEDLYMGDEFSGEKQFSRMMSILLVCMSYSSGMPILYVGAFFYFAATYIVNKVMLFQYYKKTTTLDRTLPLYTMTFLKYSIIIHMLMAILMLSNPQVLLRKSQHFEAQQKGDDQDSQSWFKRFDFLHCFIYIIVFVLVVIAYIVIQSSKGLHKILSKALLKWLRSLKEKIKAYLLKKRTTQIEMAPTKKEEDEELEKIPNDFKQEDFIANKAEQEQQEEESADALVAASLRQSEHFKSVLKHHGIEEDRISESIGESESVMPDSQEERRIESQRKEYYKKVVHPDFSDNIYMELDVPNLLNAYQRAVRDLEDIHRYFNIDESTILKVLKPHLSKTKKKPKLRVIFEEICYVCNLTFEEVTLYLDMLQQRVTDIEIVIDHHFDLIKDTIVNTKRDMIKKKMVETVLKRERKAQGKFVENAPSKKLKKDFQRISKMLESQGRFEGLEALLAEAPELDFTQYSYFDKLESLTQFADELIQNNKNQEENRRGNQTICRMTGSNAQSYFIIDQKDYQTANQLFYGFKFDNDTDFADDKSDTKSFKTNKSLKSAKSVAAKSQKDEILE